MQIIIYAAAILGVLLVLIITAVDIALSSRPKKPRHQPKKLHAPDGDSLITASGKEIRLLCIDAPELKQEHGKRAKQFLQKLIKNDLTIHERDIDQYGRTLAIVEITLNGERQTVNEIMLRYGHAWVYRKFCNTCGIPREKLFALENQARQKKWGLWQTPNPIPPWQWRYENPREEKLTLRSRL